MLKRWKYEWENTFPALPPSRLRCFLLIFFTVYFLEFFHLFQETSSLTDIGFSLFLYVGSAIWINRVRWSLPGFFLLLSLGLLLGFGVSVTHSILVGWSLGLLILLIIRWLQSSGYLFWLLILGCVSVLAVIMLICGIQNRDWNWIFGSLFLIYFLLYPRLLRLITLVFLVITFWKNLMSHTWLFPMLTLYALIWGSIYFYKVKKLPEQGIYIVILLGGIGLFSIEYMYFGLVLFSCLIGLWALITDRKGRFWYTVPVTPSPVLYFDGVCNLCNGFVQRIINHDPFIRFKLATLQSKFKEAHFDTVILKIKDLHYTESDAALMVLSGLQSNYNFCYLAILLPRFIRNIFYRWVAKYRYHWFGKSSSCMLPSPSNQAHFL